MKFIKNITTALTVSSFAILVGCSSEIPESDKSYFNSLPETKVNVDDYMPKQFVHPGILHTSERIEQMKTIVNTGASSADLNVKLAYKSWQNLTADRRAKSTYTLRNTATDKTLMLARGNGGNAGMFQDDFAAAYMNALEWAVTGNKDNANKAKEILLKYANTVAGLTENNDTPLLAGLQGFEIAYATELLSTYGDKPLAGDDLKKIEAMLDDHFVPVMEKFYNTPAYTNGNWGLIITKAYLAIAILKGDLDMYKKGMNFLFFGSDNGTFYYIDKETGQCQEQGRDQGHAQLGVGMLGSICELAYQQGVDIFTFNDNSVEKGFEYLAEYNIDTNSTLPYKQWTDVTGKYSGWKNPDSEKNTRGTLRGIYSVAYNYYVTRKGMEMPNCTKVLESNKNAECNFDSDNVGFYAFQFCDMK